MKAARRLVEAFVPEHYDLQLAINKDELTFSGVVTVQGKLRKPAQRITLHQRGLTFSAATITRHERKREHTSEVTRINTHKGYDEVRLHTDDKLYPGNYTVQVEFSGQITAKMLGIYPSYLTDDSGKKSMIVATQFEAHYAREAFPCVDEPAAKATFQLSLTLEKESKDVALSNTSLLSDKLVDGRRVIQFETTPKMSTYLLAFVIGDLHSVEAKTKDGVVVRSWSHAARDKAQLQYSVDEAVKILEFFTDYFGIVYPLTKCDMVALPDFDAGAMENWGLITYREVALLVDLANPSISSQQYVSLVVAHELSHQWFGNLVTMTWWDDLWLNESFASLMEHLALDVIHPDWQQWEMYAASDVLSASNRDIYKDIQSVGVEVTDPELIDTLFDPGIVYAKGCRLMKMLRDHLGDKVFQTGLQIYFQRHQYSNTTREDLWTALSEASGVDISSLMTPWLVQPGMPLVKINEQESGIKLSQERFVLDATDDPTLWPIPLLASEPIEPDVLTTRSATSNSRTQDYLLLNQFASGHFVTQYLQAEHRNNLAERIEKLSIPAEARMNLLNDMLLLSRRGDSSLTEALDLIIKMSDEPRDNVWGLISGVVGNALRLTEGDELAEAQLRALRRSLAQDWYKKLGWDDQSEDDANTKQLRHTALAFMVGGEDLEALAEAKKRYAAADDLETLPAETRNTILGVVVRHGETENIDKLLKLYPDASPDMQSDIAGALASTKDATQAGRILSQALGAKGFVRNQDIMRWIAYFLRNYRTRDVAWKFLEDQWAWLDATLGPSKSFDYLPTYASSVVSTEADQKRYHDFFESKLEIKALQRNIQVGFSDIAARVAWRKRDEVAIKDWLQRSATEK